MASVEIQPAVNGYVDEDGDFLPLADLASDTNTPDLLTDLQVEAPDDLTEAYAFVARDAQKSTVPTQRTATSFSSLEKYPKVTEFIELDDSGPFPSVTFEAAAVALDALMAYFNTYNRARGAQLQHARSGSAFNAHMGGVERAEGVVEGMVVKADRAGAVARRALDVLVDAPTLRARGTSESAIARSRADELDALRDSYGRAGQAGRRRKLVKSVTKLAQK